MTTFKHRSLPIEISYSEYAKLSISEKSDFNIHNPSHVSTTNNITTTNVSHKTEDVLGLGTVAAVAVIAPIAIVGSIFGMFD